MFVGYNDQLDLRKDGNTRVSQEYYTILGVRFYNEVIYINHRMHVNGVERESRSSHSILITDVNGQYQYIDYM
jgi:hypothetical protein